MRRGHFGRGAHGFSLTEVTVTVLLIGILAAIVVPKMLGPREAAKNTEAVSALQLAFSTARSYLADNRSYDGLCADDAGTTCTNKVSLHSLNQQVRPDELDGDAAPSDALGASEGAVWLGSGTGGTVSAGAAATTASSSGLEADPTGRTIVLCSLREGGDTVYCIKDDKGTLSYARVQDEDITVNEVVANDSNFKTGVDLNGKTIASTSATDGALDAEVDSPPTLMTNPMLTGQAVAGQTMLGSPGSWKGNPTPAYTYQWKRCDTQGQNCLPITGALSSAYTLVSGDVGKTVRMETTATNVAGTGTGTSDPSAVVKASAVALSTPVLQSDPSFSGRTIVGSVLTANPGSWSGEPQPEFSYQWRRCDLSGSSCTSIPSANGSTYTLGSLDSGTTIRLRVTATNSSGSATANSAPGGPISSPPVNAALPSISGSVAAGRTIVGDVGSWTGYPEADFTFQWLRCNSVGEDCQSIPQATGSEYTVAEADSGNKLRLRVTASNVAGTANATSVATSGVEGAPVNTAAPEISGEATLGKTLTATPGSWSGTPSPEPSYQWQRCTLQDDGTTVCTNISLATTSTYKVVRSDGGERLRVRVTASNPNGSASATSASTARATTPPLNTERPVLSGTTKIGDVVSVTDGMWDDYPDSEFGREWFRCDSSGSPCTPISGEIGKTHTIVAADSNKILRVKVTATNSVGSDWVYSNDSSLVVNPPVNLTPPTISGTPRVGQVLSGSVGSWGNEPEQYLFQWQICTDEAGCRDIAGADKQTYTPVDDDTGKGIKLLVIASNPSGSAQAPSAISSPVLRIPKNNSPPVITGEANRGQTLTVDPGAWLYYPSVTYDYQWIRCGSTDGGSTWTSCINIPSAIYSSYTLTSDDVSKKIKAQVTAKNSEGATSKESSLTAIVGSAPVNTELPSITGTPKVGNTLTGTNGTWAAYPAATYTYQWKRCNLQGEGCDPIANAINLTYDPVQDDAGSKLRLVVTAKNSAGTGEATSNPSAAVTALPWNKTAPVVSGNNAAGQTLSSSPGSWGGYPDPTVSPNELKYQWQRCPVDGNTSSCTSISGATEPSYTLTQQDGGSRIRSRVTATNSEGSVPAFSDLTSAVTAPPVVSADPVVTGQAKVGQTLTSSQGSWTGYPAPTYTYNWQYSQTGTGGWLDVVPPAITSSYLVPSTYAGKYLRAQVIATNSSGSATASSVGSGPVIQDPSNLTLPSISGNIQVAQTLTASPGTWDGYPSPTYAYQWEFSETGNTNSWNPIPSADRATYVLSSTYSGKYIRVTVTATNTAGSASASSPAEFVPGLPVNSSPPTISGTAQVGFTLSGTPGSWSGSPPILYNYTWQVSDTGAAGTWLDIGAPDASSYTLTSAEGSKYVRLKVTASNSFGAGEAFSLSSAQVMVPPANTSPPAMSGGTEIGSTFTSTSGSWTGTPTVSPAYKWQRSSNNSSWNYVSGALTPSLTVPVDTSWIGDYVRSEVTGSNAAGSLAVPSNSARVTGLVNTVAPVISGTARVGQVLSVNNGTWASYPAASYTYRWQTSDTGNSGWTTISNAVESTFTVPSSQAGKYLRAQVVANNTVSPEAVAPSLATAQVTDPPALISPPTLSGGMEIGSTVTTSNGTWSGFPAPTPTYKWQESTNGSSWNYIPSALASSYAIPSQSAWIGRYVRSEVTATNSTGAASEPSAPSRVTGLVNSAVPALSGTAQVGQTLTGSQGSWTSYPSASYTYQWQRSDTGAVGTWGDIATALSSSYTAQVADAGKYLRLRVTASNGTSPPVTVESLSSTQVNQLPVNTVAPTFSGENVGDETIVGTTGTWSGVPTPAYTYQWQRCESDGTTCSDISGENSASHLQVAGDIGKRMKLKVTATNAVGAVNAFSTAGATVIDPATQDQDPIGTIQAYVGTADPGDGWVLADGRAVSRTTYSDLYASTGTAYGSGDGSTTFNLPDLRGRILVGKGTNADVDVAGDNDGSTIANRSPKHQHTLYDPGHFHNWTASRQLQNTDDLNYTSELSKGDWGTGDTMSKNTDTKTTGVKVNPQGTASSSSPQDGPAFLTVNYIIKVASPADKTGDKDPIGSVQAYTGASDPGRGWVLADGRAVSRTTYANLFTASGTVFGSGDGSTTFNVPDLRGRIPVGQGTNADVDVLGDNDGSSLANRSPRHQHTVYDPGHFHNWTASRQQQGTDDLNYTSEVSKGDAGTGDTMSKNTDTKTTGVKVNPQGAASSSSPQDGPAFLTGSYVIKVANISGSIGDTDPVGSIQGFAGGSAPTRTTSWVGANGVNNVSRTTYSDLFSLIGTTFGAGADGTTFSLPDAQGRAVVGQGTNADVDVLGDNDGSSLANRSPKHQHTVYDPGHFHNWTASRQLQGRDDSNYTSEVSKGDAGTPDTMSKNTDTKTTGLKVNPQGTASSSSPQDTPAYLTSTMVVRRSGLDLVPSIISSDPVTVSGTARVGQTLTAYPGTWNGTPRPALTYQWQVSDNGTSGWTNISSANSLTYTLASAQAGKYVRFQTSATNTRGTITSESSPSAQVTQLPTNITAPALSGTERVGNTLTASQGSWEGFPTPAYTYQWQVSNDGATGWTNIAGANALNYTILSGDLGKYLRIQVTATNSVGATTTPSLSSGIVAAAPVNTVLPTVGGTAEVGQVLSTTGGTWTGPPAPNLTYQWQRCDVALVTSGCVDIAGANSSSYTLTSSDVAKRLRVRVTGTNVAGSQTVDSLATAIVPGANGGTVTNFGNYRIHSFTSTGSSTFSAYRTLASEYLIVAGGGGGGNGTGSGYEAGAGGAGGLLQGSTSVSSGSYSVTVGGGGGASAQGGSSSALGVSATGGGGGASSPGSGGTGGSGGGGSHSRTAGGAGTSGQGYAGATPGTSSAGGGGGGAGEAGNTDGQGSGGDGVQSSITGTPTWYAGGGAAYAPGASVLGTPGDGGGGSSTTTLNGSSTAGTANTGGGGGGGYNSGGGGGTSGGSGVVIIRYPEYLAPANTVLPTISGTVRTTQTLTANVGTWNGFPTPTYTYQWQISDTGTSGWTDIASATSSTYTIPEGQAGKYARVIVTATNSITNASATSLSTTQILQLPQPGTAPTISGTVKAGQSLASTNGTWTGVSNSFTYTYQWQRTPSGQSSWVDIASATSAAYTLQSADGGYDVRLQVTATNSAGSVTNTSNTLGPVQAAPVNTNVPAISGLSGVGSTLTATSGVWLGFPFPTYAYQWQSSGPANFEYLVIAGGGGGGGNGGGGGGAGGYRTNVVGETSGGGSAAEPPLSLSQGTYPVTVGAGASAAGPANGIYFNGGNGADSSFAGVTSTGGGGGSASGNNISTQNGRAGGSGGGASSYTLGNGTGGSGSSGQGYAGGNSPAPASNWRDSGGGGAGGAGGVSPSAGVGGVGGAGLTSSITGSAVTRASGGSGYLQSTATAGGGAASAGTGTANTGGGGGGGTTANGGSGIVVVRYPVSSGVVATGGTITTPTIGGVQYKVHTFTSSGSFVVTDTGGWTDISGATSSTYVPQISDLNRYLRVKVTATNSEGSVSATSASQQVVAPPVNTVLPSISGTLAPGQTITTTTGTWTSLGTTTYAYQWVRCDETGANCSDIAGATSQNYTLGVSDAAKTMQVKVTASNAAGPGSQVTSATSLPVSSASGGTITTSGSWRIHTFYNTGASTFNLYRSTDVEYLVVAGGGGGGMDMGGGGGGGGFLDGTASLTGGTTYNVTVGAGGTGGPAGCSGSQPCAHQFTQSATKGGNSSLSGGSLATITAQGGGYGGSSYYQYTPNNGAGSTGGSGGGASGYTCGAEVAGAAGTSGQGNRGGDSGNPASTACDYYSGGGGGAGAVGTYGPNLPHGGAGKASSILGTTYYFAGGGGGAGYSGCGGNGGIGGGGGGAICTTTGGGSALNSGAAGGGGSTGVQANVPGGNAGANTGGGGGGGSHYNSNNKGGDGGSGIVVIRYQDYAKPANSAVPTVSGTVRSGQTLTAANGTWTGFPAPSYTYQWQTSNDGSSGWTDISGANASTYSIPTSQIQKYLRVTVTASNSLGSTSANSASTTQVQQTPVNTAAPTVSGTARVGQTLTASNGTWDAFPTPPTYTYQWQVSPDGGSSWNNIADGGTFTEYSSGLTASSSVMDIARGPDGNMWFTSGPVSRIGRITPTGSITEFTTPTSSSYPESITAGPDNSLWYTARGNGSRVGKVSTSGSITEFDLPSNFQPMGITAGPDGNLWVSGSGILNTGRIARMTPDGKVTEFSPPSRSELRGMRFGPDGNLWFTYYWNGSADNKIGRLNPSTGEITEFTIPTSGAGPNEIIPGPDGAMWFTERTGNKIGRITTSGEFTEYTVPTGSAEPFDIAAGPDGAIWFTQSNGNKIGRITTSGAFTEYTVPTAYSAPRGIALGPDDRMWFVQSSGNKIAAITAGSSVASSYVVEPGDAGRAIRVQVTATNSAGAATSSSTATSAAEYTPTNTAIPSVSQTPVSGWTPNQADSKPLLWVRPESLNTKDSAEKVGYWKDSSGNGNALGESSSSLQPTWVPNQINGYGAVQFTATAQSAGQRLTNNTNFETPYTLMYVGRLNGSVNHRLMGGLNNNYILGTWNGLQNQLFAEGWVHNPSTTATQSWNLWGATGSGTSSAMYQNGTLQASNSGGLQGPNGLALGCGYATATSDCSTGQIAEVIAVKDDLSTAERQKLEGYLAWKYNLQSSLPASHPFRNAAPGSQGTSYSTTNGTWSGSPAPSYTYQWQRCTSQVQSSSCSDISGATSSSYSRTYSDGGQFLRARVTATNSAGSATASSGMTSRLEYPAPTNTTAPSIAASVTTAPRTWVKADSAQATAGSGVGVLPDESGNGNSFYQGGANRSYSEEVLRDNPLAYYKLDETSGTSYTDLSGNGIPLTGGNAATFTSNGPSAAINDRSLSFNGNSASVLQRNPLSSKTSDYTMEAWIYPANLSQQGMVMLNGVWSGQGYGFGVFNASGGAGGCLTGLHSNVVWVPSGYCFPSANTWYHVAMSRASDGTVRFYVNGSQVNSQAPSGPSVPTNEFTVGASRTSAADATRNNLFSGRIGYAAMYNKQLPGGRIAEHYRAALRPTMVSSGVGSKPTMRFDGVNDVLDSSRGSYSTPMTVMAVASKSAAGAGYERILHGSSTAAPNDAFMFMGANAGSFTTFTGSGTAWNDTNTNSPSTAIGSSGSLLGMTTNGTTLTPYVNGTAQTTKTGSMGSFTGMRMGASIGGVQLWNGDISEVVIFPDVLSQADRESMEGYLAWKYGLQGSLPASHPYKNAAPDVSGALKTGQVLLGYEGRWSNMDSDRTARMEPRWYRCDSSQASSSSSVPAGCTQTKSDEGTYATSNSDTGKHMVYGVTATNSGGSAEGYSASAGPVGRAPLNTSIPTITGTSKVGDQLTGAQGSWIGHPTPTYSYQWQSEKDTASIDYLVVAGGGGGGGTIAGGGGAGGMLEGSTTLSNSSSYTVTVGTGGTGAVGWNNTPAQGTSGTNSSISGSGVSTITATGGGAGAAYGGGAGTGLNALTGGSGGGAGSCGTNTGAAGIAGQGNAGGSSNGNCNNAAGGGGAGAAAGNATTNASSAGGVGKASSITGTSVFYAGGGGGGARNGNGAGGAGGNGGGGTGSTIDTGLAAGVDATANTGGGGGGCGHNGGSANRCGGNGGSGVVIIRYPVSSGIVASGGTESTVTISGVDYKVHRFTSSSTFTVSEKGFDDIAGATSQNFTPVRAQSGKRLRLKVTATNSNGTVSANSSNTAATIETPYNTAAPVISGNPSDDDVLTATTGTWGGSPLPPTYGYQWQTSSDGGSTWSNAPGAGATTASYTVAAADATKLVRVLVTATNSAGSSTAAASNNLGPVILKPTVTWNQQPSTPVSNGTTTSAGTFTLGGGAATSIQCSVGGSTWVNCDTATSHTYTLGAVCSDNSLQVRVSNAGGSRTVTRTVHRNCNPPTISITSAPPHYYYTSGTYNYTTTNATSCSFNISAAPWGGGNQGTWGCSLTSIGLDNNYRQGQGWRRVTITVTNADGSASASASNDWYSGPSDVPNGTFEGTNSGWSAFPEYGSGFAYAVNYGGWRAQVWANSDGYVYAFQGGQHWNRCDSIYWQDQPSLGTRYVYVAANGYTAAYTYSYNDRNGQVGFRQWGWNGNWNLFYDAWDYNGDAYNMSGRAAGGGQWCGVDRLITLRTRSAWGGAGGGFYDNIWGNNG